MSVLTTEKKYDYIFQNYSLANFSQTDELFEESHESRLPYGVSFMKQWMFEGIRILYTRNNFNSHYLFKNLNESNFVNLEFNLKGRYSIFHLNNIYQVKHLQHNIVYTPGTHNYFENGDLNTETFKIEFSPKVFLEIICNSNDLLKQFAEQMLANKPAVISKSSGIIDLQLYNAVNQIINCNFSGNIRKTFLLSKCLEILVLQAESFARTEHPRYTHSNSELEKLEYVRKYITDHIDMPPSLRELARLSGLNEYKLKKSFKEVYHTTVFGYLADYRLNEARKKLESSDRSIAEIAYDLGYSSPQHFAKAFKEKFGLTPKFVQKAAY